MDQLAVVDAVGSEPEAERLCAILRSAGVECLQRLTRADAGGLNGSAHSRSHEIVVRREQLELAHATIAEQRG